MTLPAPDPAFHWTPEAWGFALRCARLAEVAQHAFTTKQLPLRPATPHVWAQAVASVGGRLEQLMRVKQVHGSAVRVLRRDSWDARLAAERPEADAMVSDAPGLVLSVQVADCAPILLADPRTGVVGAVHAGWRGTSAGVARAAVAALTREFGVDPADVTAAIGPSIGPCCYEVGPEIMESFRQDGAAIEDITRWFSHAADGSLRLDLWTATRDQLRAAGVQGDRIFTCRLCTQTHGDIFESYRVDGEDAGRMAALIRVPGAP